MTYLKPHSVLLTESKLELRCPEPQCFLHHQEYCVHIVNQEKTEAHGLEAETTTQRGTTWLLGPPPKCPEFPIHQPTALPFQLERQELQLPNIMLGKLPGVLQADSCHECVHHVLGEGLLGDAHDTAHQGPPPPSSQGQTQGGRRV